MMAQVTGKLRLSRYQAFLIQGSWLSYPYLLRCLVASSYNGIPLPNSGSKITFENGKLVFPDKPIIPFIEGDGTGRDIWKASVRVFDAAVEKAYGGKRKIHWMEIFAGEKANKAYNSWLPDATVEAFKTYLVGIK